MTKRYLKVQVEKTVSTEVYLAVEEGLWPPPNAHYKGWHPPLFEVTEAVRAAALRAAEGLGWNSDWSEADYDICLATEATEQEAREYGFTELEGTPGE